MAAQLQPHLVLSYTYFTVYLLSRWYFEHKTDTEAPGKTIKSCTMLDASLNLMSTLTENVKWTAVVHNFSFETCILKNSIIITVPLITSSTRSDNSKYGLNAYSLGKRSCVNVYIAR